MSKKITKIAIILMAFLCPAVSVFSQDGTYNSYSPYTVFGFGDLIKQGTAYNQTMGGVGIAGRDRKYVNTLNPAAVTARDTLSFMLDFSMSSSNRIFNQGKMRSANNTFNISNIAFTFPLYKKSAMIFGISPYSDVGYDFSNYTIDYDYERMNYSSSGNGGVYKIYGGAGLTLWKNLNLGAELDYYFGNIDKTTNMDISLAGARDLSMGYIMQLNGVGAKFGLQYTIPLKDDWKLNLGATYSTGSNIHGYVTDYRYATLGTLTDTLYHKVDTITSNGKIKIASEYGFGVSLTKGDKWNFEVDYLISDWRNSGLDRVNGFANEGNSKFSTSISHSMRAGFEYTPNRNDVRYYMRKVAYRFGTYYDSAYYRLDGNTVNSFGLTFGMTLPILRYYNGLTFGIDIGQRGSLKGNMVRERYVNFKVGFNIHDIWFVKPKYN